MDQHLSIACNNHAGSIEGQTLPTWVGEWSVAYKVGSGSAHYEPFPNENEKRFLKEFVLAQMKAFGSFFFWTMRTDPEQPAYMWDYMQGVKEGWLPPKLPHPDMDKVCTGEYHTLPTRFESPDWPPFETSSSSEEEDSCTSSIESSTSRISSTTTKEAPKTTVHASTSSSSSERSTTSSSGTNSEDENILNSAPSASISFMFMSLLFSVAKCL